MANPVLANETHQRSLKDFLTLYNTITEYCFNKCISNFNERSASGNETFCIDTCTNNYVQYNQRFMFTFVDTQERRKRETENAAIEAAAKEATAVQAAPPQEMTASQQEQLQKAAQLLEGLSTSQSNTSSNLNPNLTAVSGANTNQDLSVNNGTDTAASVVQDQTPPSQSQEGDKS